MVEWLSDIDNPDEACRVNITDDAEDSQSFRQTTNVILAVVETPER